MFVFFEGLISGGKTTALETVQDMIHKQNVKMPRDIQIIKEPVDIWRKIGLLDSFYKDITRWSYTFQNVAFITKMMELSKANDPNTIYLVERSPFADRNIFAKLCYENGQMTEMEWQAYTLWYEHYIQTIGPHQFIYIKTSPETCMERIKKRGRKEEQSIPIEYMKSLETKHEEWFAEETNFVQMDGEVAVETLANNIIDFIRGLDV